MAESTSLQLLRRPAVEKMTGLKTSILYALVRSGELKPPVWLSRQCTAWRIVDVQEFIDGRRYVTKGRGCAK